jgi:hypothetical protein
LKKTHTILLTPLPINFMLILLRHLQQVSDDRQALWSRWVRQVFPAFTEAQTKVIKRKWEEEYAEEVESVDIESGEGIG